MRNYYGTPSGVTVWSADFPTTLTASLAKAEKKAKKGKEGKPRFEAYFTSRELMYATAKMFEFEYGNDGGRIPAGGTLFFELRGDEGGDGASSFVRVKFWAPGMGDQRLTLRLPSCPADDCPLS